jgi:hypothetical protein
MKKNKKRDCRKKDIVIPLLGYFAKVVKTMPSCPFKSVLYNHFGHILAQGQFQSVITIAGLAGLGWLDFFFLVGGPFLKDAA